MTVASGATLSLARTVTCREAGVASWLPAPSRARAVTRYLPVASGTSSDQPVLAAPGAARSARRWAPAVVLPQLPSALSHSPVSRSLTSTVTEATPDPPAGSLAVPVSDSVGGATTASCAGEVTTVSGAPVSAPATVKDRVAVAGLPAWSGR